MLTNLLMKSQLLKKLQLPRHQLLPKHQLLLKPQPLRLHQLKLLTPKFLLSKWRKHKPKLKPRLKPKWLLSKKPKLLPLQLQQKKEERQSQ